ncbi:MAG TPA: PP2C family serine/threonine-protein phosphatase [Gemmataceae bacterium]|nr:PP2C family serine/threonine-protein phosphatase [Gemmataceae bacterium]
MNPSAVDVKYAPPARPPASVWPPKSAPSSLSVQSHGRSDPGVVRPSNEDQFLIASLSKALHVEGSSVEQPEVKFSDPLGTLFVVADGCGGHAGGEKASQLAVRSIEQSVVDTLNWCAQLRIGADGEALLGEFKKALSLANERLNHEADRHPQLHGMATTLTLAYFLRRDLFVAHVGDSRCYLLRKNLLYRLTRDHTMVAEMVRRGLIKPDDAAHHPYRHVVTNVVGGSDPGVDVEMHKLPLEAGDSILLCSDGLTEMVPDTDILNVLVTSQPDPAAACDRLTALANEKGGKDNVTVIVARFDEQPS